MVDFVQVEFGQVEFGQVEFGHVEFGQVDNDPVLVLLFPSFTWAKFDHVEV